ncbi:enoyl-CoA hydratase [Siccirubricoccus sp. G192]|uniref:enoyl-CoA hydratase n=1 Tax=Siccirubricoccus sp. G192 TaxID=2849651 RepID=UPI001C2C5B1E|nr:enoyl-CoA hydratase [Siccirubricoccus sp. G192]MBV1798022.1 enoyl-CoA hydratase [Siccirubricoccus sp. G192]
MEPELLTERLDGVLLLTMNRPDALNALGGTMMWDMLQAMQTAATDPAIGCVVLTGAGRGFSAGGDMKARATGAKPPPATPEQGADELRARMECSRLLHEMPKPTIAMVNGVAAGAGMSLALACDMRIAGESARMTTAFAKMGFSGDFGGHYFLARLVGPARARELYFTSEVLDAAKLERLGLVNRVVPDAALREETMVLARQLGQGPRVAWRYMKRNMKAAEEGTLSEALDAEAIGMMRCRDTEDHAEALRAFMEKRPPVFSGR